MAKSDHVTAKFIALIGADATLALIEQHAGCELYVPRKAATGNAPQNLLELQIGLHAAARLIAEHGGETLRIPLARFWRAQIYRERDMTVREIALKLGVGEGGVYRLLNLAGVTCDGARAHRTRERGVTRSRAMRAEIRKAGEE